MNAFQIIGILLGIFGVVAMLSLFVFLGIWVYKDAKSRGLNPALWTVIVLVAIQGLIGLLLYLLVGRRSPQIACPECSAMTSEKAPFCEKCGKPIEQERVEKRKSAKKWLIAMLIAFIIGIMFVAGSLGSFFKGGFPDRIPDNISIGKIEKGFTKRWNVTFYRSTETLSRTVRIRNDAPDTLYLSGSCEKGSMILVISMDDEVLIYDMSDQAEEIQIDLSGLDDTVVRLKLVNCDANDGEFEARWE
jgi:predicted nucleic acid-binding Zn ribbon protein